jgi:hypothetical protein
LDKLKHVPHVGHALACRAGRQPGHSPQATEGDEAQPPLADGRDLVESANLGRLVLAYRREPGTTRFEGSIVVKELAVEAAER